MTTVSEIRAWMENLAPPALSEDWDNTGLLLGDPTAKVTGVQTCLTITPVSVSEAVEQSADLIIAHHPLPFRPLDRITTETTPGKMLWELANHGIAIYAPHTAWDSATRGINALLAEKMELQQCEPISPLMNADLPGLGAGRIGTLARGQSLPEVAECLRAEVPYCRLRGVDSGQPIRRVAICCGSGGSLLSKALQLDCDLFLTGEATFHTCLEAEAAGRSLLMLGHFASERFAMEHLADALAREMPNLRVWASQRERDPVVSFNVFNEN